ncbi:MAG: hypothetical protein OXE46_07450 [Chloroflexi bacterium]|nr:hypothetical protein [Chloroflexota bacterium]
MNRLTVKFIAVVWAVFMFALPTAQAADIELNDTCSLADAITAANTDAVVGGCAAGEGADTITLSSDITLDAALPQITTEITIEGAGYTISGDNRFRIFTVNGGGLTVNNLSITKGFADWGGAIANVNGGALTVNNSTISKSEATEGGAVGNESTLVINSSEIISNLADVGGAIYISSGRVTLTACNVSYNYLKDNGEGGAIYLEGGTISIIDCTLTENTISGRSWGINKGGAVFLESGRLMVDNSSFTRNSVNGNGGAIYNEEGDINIEDSRFIENTARHGGTMYNNFSSEVSINTSTFKNNAALGSGGGIYNTWPYEITISNGTFDSNTAGNDGGAIYSSGKIEMTDSTLISNSAGQSGGAIYTELLVTIVSSTMGGNSAGELGGGLYLHDSSEWSGAHSLTQVTVTHNSATSGGGIYKEGGAKASLINSIIAGNEGGDCFGRIAENVANFIADGSCFATLSGDPMLGELIEPEDGSPPYYPLQEGSPAIDAASRKWCPKTDIVGTRRPQGAGCDIGAYELPAG